MAALETLCNPQPWSAGSLRALADPERARSGWVVQDSESLLGYAFASLVAGECEILILGVHPSARRQGIARNLMEHLLRQVCENGAKTVFLEVREGNAAARTLYRSVGFVETGVRHGYYSDNGENAVLLRRDC